MSGQGLGGMDKDNPGPEQHPKEAPLYVDGRGVEGAGKDNPGKKRTASGGRLI